MPDFQKMYFELAGKVADAIYLLIAAQQQAEDTYIESEEDSVADDDLINERR